MTEEKLIEIKLNDKTDLLAVRTECPRCGDKYLYGVPYVSVPCKKCGILYKTDFKQDIYTKKARQLEDKKSEGDGIIIKATAPYKQQLIHIMYNHLEQKCWNVSEIKNSTESYKRCLNCGICMDCFTCKECGNQFEKDKKRRKQECPNCKSSDFTKTYFKKAKVKENKVTRICPECDSENIRLTRTTNKSKCHLCGCKNLSESKTDVMYELTIKRKKAYRK